MRPPVKPENVGVSYMTELFLRSWNRAAPALLIDCDSTLLPEVKLPLEMPNMAMVSPYSLYTVSMLPSFTVPKAPLDRPTKELREPKVPLPTSKLVDCSSCQMPLRPPKPLPRPRSPRKPMYELPTWTYSRGGVSSMRPFTAPAVPSTPLVAVDATSVETGAPGCVVPLVLDHWYCG